MSAQSNLKVFCFLRVLECVQSLICLIIHIYGTAATSEPFKHEFIFCGTYFSFVLISLFAAANLGRNFLSYRSEIVNASVGYVLFTTASIWSMVTVENDKHLIALTDSEEAAHIYFKINRVQSVASLVAAFMFLLHITLALDYVLTAKGEEQEVYWSEPKRLQLYFFPQLVWNRLRRLFSRNE